MTGTPYMYGEIYIDPLWAIISVNTTPPSSRYGTAMGLTIIIFICVCLIQFICCLVSILLLVIFFKFLLWAQTPSTCWQQLEYVYYFQVHYYYCKCNVYILLCFCIIYSWPHVVLSHNVNVLLKAKRPGSQPLPTTCHT